MFKYKHKAISAILLTSLGAVSICSCNIGSDPISDPTLPTTESISTSMTTYETSEETTAETSAETTAASESGTYETAPESTGINTDFVRTADYVTPEMMTPDFWIREEILGHFAKIREGF